MQQFIIVFILFILGVAQASNAKREIYKIRPFVYLDRGKNYATTWQFKNQNVEHGILSLPLCGFGDNNPAGLANIACPTDSKPVRFTFMADTQEGLQTDEKFFKMVKSFDSQAVIIGGDLVQNGGNHTEWEDFFKSTGDLFSHCVLIPVVGNHEYRGDPRALSWKKYFNFDADQAYYSAWLGPVHIIVLNSSFEDDFTLMLKQVPWLEGELEKPAPWKVVVFHHPPYSRSVMQSPTYVRKEYKYLREYYVPVFEKNKVDLVLNGHTHMFEHSYRNDVHYLTTGAAGGRMGIGGAENQFELQSEEERTIIQFEVSAQELHATAVTLDNQILDYLVLKK